MTPRAVASLLCAETSFPVSDTLDYLLGGWSIERRITDLQSGETGTFRGTAEWTLDRARRGDEASDQAAYSEVGRLRIGGYDGPSRRRLRCSRRCRGAIAISFADGRPFVECDLGTGHSEAVHLCGADRYRIAYLARGHDRLDEAWSVDGLAKRYRALAVLRRLA